MSERLSLHFLVKPIRSVNVFWYFVVALPLVTICVLLFIDPNNLYSEDLMLIAGNPGRDLLTNGTIDAGYPYPLWTVVVMLPFAVIAPKTAMLIWLACNIVMLAVSLAMFFVILEWELTPILFILTITHASLYMPVLTSLGLGQLTILSLLFFAFSTRFFINQNWLGLGIVLGLSLIKPQIMFLLTGGILLWALFQRRWQVWFGFGAIALLLVLISIPFASTPQQIIGGGIGDHLNTYIRNTGTLWGLLTNLGFSYFVPFFVTIFVLFWLGWLWIPLIRVQEMSASQAIFLFSATVTANMIVLPYSWSYNHILLLLPFGYCLSLIFKTRGLWRGFYLFLLFCVMFPLTITIFIAFPQAFQIIPVLVLLPFMIFLKIKISLQRDYVKQPLSG